MEFVAKSFWLFLTKPNKFTLEWLANRNNIQESLFPIALLGIISVILVNGLALLNLRKKYQNFKDVFWDVVKYLLQLFLTLGYFVILGLFSSKYYFDSIIIFKNLKFAFTIIGFIILSLFLILVLIMLLSFLNQGLEKTLIFCQLKPEPSFNFDKNKASVNCNPVGFIIIAINTIYWITIFKNTIIVTSVLLDVSWWLIIIVSVFYSIFSIIIRFAIAIFLPNSRNSQKTL